MAGPYTVDSYADVVAAKIDQRGLAQTVLLGHSMGGKVALALAARRPPTVCSLVLLAPSPPTPEPITDSARAALLAQWAIHDAAERTLAGITGRALSEDARNRAIDDLTRCGKAAWSAWLNFGSREDIAAAMPRISVPVALLSGSCDTVLPTALISREVAARLCNASMGIIPGAGHLLTLEAPDAVAAAIVSFVHGQADGRRIGTTTNDPSADVIRTG